MNAVYLKIPQFHVPLSFWFWYWSYYPEICEGHSDFGIDLTLLYYVFTMTVLISLTRQLCMPFLFHHHPNNHYPRRYYHCLHYPAWKDCLSHPAGNPLFSVLIAYFPLFWFYLFWHIYLFLAHFISYNDHFLAHLFTNYKHI